MSVDSGKRGGMKRGYGDRYVYMYVCWGRRDYGDKWRGWGWTVCSVEGDICHAW